MDISKYKEELESAIYEVDGKFYIGGKVVEKVLMDFAKKLENKKKVEVYKRKKK